MWIWISMGLTACSLYLLCWWFSRPFVQNRDVPPAVRPLLLRMIWPWVDALEPVCRPLMSWHMRRRTEDLLQKAGAQNTWSPSHLRAFQCVLALLAAAAAVSALHRHLSPPMVLASAVALALFAASWPVQRMGERIRRRKRMMSREFPFLLDMITLCVEAGLNLHGALRQAANNGPAGPLRDELHHTLSDIRTGASRSDALTQWAQRCDLPALHHFVAAIAQAEQSGMSLGPVLRAQADQRRNERFLRAEKLALEAPVKMMFPLIFCIFPCSFLIIAFPIAGKFLALAG